MSEALKKKKFKDLYEDLCALPKNVVGEIINGELIAQPRPALIHASASSTIGSIILPPYQLGENGPGGWWILDEPEVHLKDQVIVPDVGGWKRERLPKLAEKVYFSVAPDWACEVLSPSTARYDRISKLKIYAENKVPYYWIVDPLNRVLEVLILDGKSYKADLIFEKDDLVKAPPFEDLEFNLGKLWPD